MGFSSETSRQPVTAPISLAVLIITLDRPAILATTLGAWRASNRLPDQFLVVDASYDAAERRTQVLERYGALFAGPGSDYLCTKRASTTFQRNHGLERVQTDVVIFVDDDTVPSPDYLDQLAEVYASDVTGRLGGVSGIDSARLGPRGRLKEAARRPSTRLAQRLRVEDWLAFPSQLPMISMPPEVPVVRRATLRGCNMSFRTELARAARFDEDMRGWAYCEDFDVSFRISRTHVLLTRKDAVVRFLVPHGGTVPAGRFFFIRWINAGYLIEKLQLGPSARRSLRRFLWLSWITALVRSAPRGPRAVAREHAKFQAARRALDALTGLDGEALRVLYGRLQDELEGSEIMTGGLRTMAHTKRGLFDA